MIIREIEISNCIIDFNLPFDIKPKTNQSKKIAMKSIYVMLSVALILFSCKEKCGCGSEPYKTVNNVEATLYYGVHLEIHGGFVICNKEILPEEIKLMSIDARLEGINVIVSGDLHKGCKDKMESEIPPGITLSEIILPEK